MRRVTATVMAGHFIAAFAALGMPPFFGLVLERSLGSDARYLAGWLYVTPALFTALSAPWWGRLADRHGKKLLLLRAQLGLAASFLLAGFAPNTAVFGAALVLQGLLGGTFSASNAYLATQAGGHQLARALTLMQWSARAALVAAPLALGVALRHTDSPLVLYRYLALLPLAAALMIWRLPDGAAVSGEEPTAVDGAAIGSSLASARQIYWLQFTFVFATVITFPYFVGAAGGADDPALAGLLFGLPHLVYLLAAVPLGRRLGQRAPAAALALAFLLHGAALLGQGMAGNLAFLSLWRVLMGLSMTAGYIVLHAMVAAIVRSASAGSTFGWFDSSSKWGGVAAGLAAGAVVQAADGRAPFFIGAAVMLACAGYLAGLTTLKHWSPHANR